MDPKIWGPHQWFMMHTISFTYPENPSPYDKRIYNDYYSSLKDVLPCDACKKHYNTFIMQHPLGPHLDKRRDLIQWVIDIHNFVNKNTGKPELSFDEVMYIYKNLKPISPFAKTDVEELIEKKKEKNYYKQYAIMLLLLFIIIGIKYYFNRYYFYL
jgi:hypothetical protein